jgi:hypothetical protein
LLPQISQAVGGYLLSESFQAAGGYLLANCSWAAGVNFRSAVGALSYLSTAKRPKIAFAVSNLLQFLENPGITHWEALTHVLRYLAGTPDYALTYLCWSVANLQGFTDADWGNCPMTRRSVTGFLALQNHHLICWQTKKQPVVSLSTCKAEYRALVDFSCKLLCLRQFCIEVGISSHYKHLQLCPERKCKIGMGKTYTQFYRKWSEVKNKL